MQFGRRVTTYLGMLRCNISKKITGCAMRMLLAAGLLCRPIRPIGPRPDPILTGGSPGPCDPNTASADYVGRTDVNGNPVAPADLDRPAVPVPGHVDIPIKVRKGAPTYVSADGKSLAPLLNPPSGCALSPTREALVGYPAGPRSLQPAVLAAVLSRGIGSFPGMRAFLLVPILALAGLILGGPAQAAPISAWRITSDHWSPADEEGFGRFVTALGESGCTSSESCLRSAANPWRDSDGHFKDVDVDCAKLPYLLRAYYAWKNGLPFSYVDGVRGSGDLRFSKSANHPVSRADVVDHGGGIEGPKALRAMLDAVYTATYRTDAAQARGVTSDFYSPAIQPGSIHPGTVIYDINGHVGIVYKVDAAGRIYYMDAHPDFTISRSVYGAQFGQSPMALGGGLKNWRPLQLRGAHVENGALVGGHVALAANGQIPDFSLVQYLGTEPGGGKARFSYNGAPLGFYEYVRVAVSGGRTDFNPVYELEGTMQSLCNDLNDRAQYVNQATANGISAKLHPSANPANIYSSDDSDWESYATPARDARLRAGFVQFHHDLAEMIGLWVARDPRIVYDGQFLKQDLLAAYDRESRACTITYLSSDKKPVPLSFDDISHRLLAMSFDPYNCVELRWGDESPACPDQEGKRRWYAEAEARAMKLAAMRAMPSQTVGPRRCRHSRADRRNARAGAFRAADAVRGGPRPASLQ